MRPTLPAACATVLATAIAIACGARSAHSQVTQPTWVTPDNSPPGTPASITLDPQASTPQQSVFDFVLHGYWLTPRTGDDGRAYQQVSAPGLMTTMEFGAPELPVYRFALGIVTGANAVAFTGVQVRAQSTLSGMLPWPHIVGAVPDSVPRADRFVRDEAKYAQMSDYPGGVAQSFDGVDPGLGGLHARVCELHPFHWNASGALSVIGSARFTFDHPGNPTPIEMGSAQSAAASLAGLANAGTVLPWVIWDHLKPKGYFLFVVPSGYAGCITPLVEQKKKRGYWVTVIYTDDIPFSGPGEPTCKPTRDAIDAWYAGTPRAAEHFCILAGNTVSIPMCFESRPNGYEIGSQLATDDYYGDADGNGINDMGKEVWVGRLVAHDATEMTDQVNRILAYEDKPTPFQSYGRAGLVAWNSASDDRFQKAMNVVTSASYASVTPLFDVVDGGKPFVNNAWVDGVAQTDGIVAYNGHGSSTEWWAWNTAALSYSNTHVDALVNHPVTPIVWSLACYTGNILYAGSFGHEWMTRGADGAVSFYGATEASWIWDNGIMVRRLFDAVFNHSFTTQGIAIAFEEFGTILETSTDNPVQYLLLGDPEMQIRRQDVPFGPPYVVHVPPFLVAGPVTPLDVNVINPAGRPAAGVKVALWKRSVIGGGAAAHASHASHAPGAARAQAADEVLDARYADAQGNAHFDLPAMTSGTLYVTTFDDDANVVLDSIAVSNGSAVDAGAAAARFCVAGSVARGSVEFLLPALLGCDSRVAIYDVSGRAVRSLRVVPGSRSIAWDGAGDSGARARPGLYLARLEGAGSAAAPARFVMLN